jgi:hypothetical protein
LWKIKTIKPKKTLNLKFIEGFNGTMITHHTQKGCVDSFQWLNNENMVNFKTKGQAFLELTTQQQKLDGF